MAALLTYHPRRGLLEAAAAGKRFLLPIHYDHARVTAWEHRFEIRTGRYTLWDHTFELPSGRARGNVNTNASVIYRIATQPHARAGYDYPGEYAQRFDGVDKGGGSASHSHPGPSVYVGPLDGGIYLHALPLCNRKTCIVVMQQWDDLRRAIAGEPNLSFSLAG
jgi:hypothetical protein